MSKGQRIRGVLSGISTILLAFIIFLIPADISFNIIASVLSISLIALGIRELVYYFQMARHMVGGRTLFFLAVIILDFGIFTFTLTDIPSSYLMLYIFATHGFGGAIEILRALEAKRLDSPSWKFDISRGGMDLLVAILCVVFLKHIEVLVYVYSAGLVYSGVTRIISSLRKTEIIYIQ